MSTPIAAHKVTLSTGKTVMLREPRIKDQELAAISAAGKAGSSGENKVVLQVLMQKELLKQLIVSINDKPISPALLEDLDGIFTYKEYGQLLQVLQQVAGDDQVGKPQIEVSTSGGK